MAACTPSAAIPDSHLKENPATGFAFEKDQVIRMGSQPHVLGTFHRGCRNQHCSVRLPVLTLRYAQIWHCQRKHNSDYDGRHCFQSHRIPLDSIRAYHQRATTHGRGQWSRDNEGLTLAPVSQDMHSISAVI